MSDSSRVEGDPNAPLPYGTGIFANPTNVSGENQGVQPGPGGVVPSQRVEANTLLIKLSQDASTGAPGEVNTSGEINTSGLMGLGSSNLLETIPEEQDDQGTEAASARIAQEYRRQVRIKRLAEEIQQAEKDKKREDQRKREGTDIRGSELKPRQETARISPPTAETTNLTNQEPLADVEAEENKRRAEAMSAFKGAERKRGNSPVRLMMFATVTLLLCGVIVGAFVLLSHMDQQNKKLAQENEQRAKQMQLMQQQTSGIDPNKVAALEAKLEQEKQAREEAERKIAAEKVAREEALRKQEEQAKILQQEREAMLAESKKIQEAAQKLEEENRRRDEELRRKSEEASRLAREKLKREQAEREAKVLEKSVAATPQGEVRTNPPQPAGINGKSDLPTGAVRLFCKASDPYGGKLSFHWTQVKGAKVEISDPNAALERNGKWYSQTYFIAREPGAYEFELSVKNEDGVETLRKYPIEVLPISQLK